MDKNKIQKRKGIREAFKVTLTQEQIIILTDPRMTKDDKLQSLSASLTDQQKNMIKTIPQEIKTLKR